MEVKQSIKLLSYVSLTVLDARHIKHGEKWVKMKVIKVNRANF